MDFYISKKLDKYLKKIKSRDKQLVQKVEKQLSLFQQNHLHPSLKAHKLSGNLNNIWSISIDRNIRMTYILEDNTAHFIDLGTHDQVYKK